MTEEPPGPGIGGEIRAGHKEHFSCIFLLRLLQTEIFKYSNQVFVYHHNKWREAKRVHAQKKTKEAEKKKKQERINDSLRGTFSRLRSALALGFPQIERRSSCLRWRLERLFAACCSSASPVLGPEMLTFEPEAKELTAVKILPWVSMVGVRE